MADRVRPSEELRQAQLPPKEQRHLLPSQAHSIPIVRNHRRWLARDIDRMLTRSWDPSLSVDELQALNDDINEAVRRRSEWDQRLVELGGVLETVSVTTSSGGRGGYMYFGRAKELLAPGQDDPSSSSSSLDTRQSRRRHGALYLMVDAEYYGFHHGDRGRPHNHNTQIVVPSRQEVEAAILRAKKAALLARLDKASI